VVYLNTGRTYPGLKGWAAVLTLKKNKIYKNLSRLYHFEKVAKKLFAGDKS
jgi:hypothetical protein